MPEESGPFTLAQARAAGVTDAGLRAGLRRGELIRLRHGVLVSARERSFAEADPRARHAQDVAALMLAMPGRDLVAAGTSAARIHGLQLLGPRPAGIVVLSGDPGASRTARDGYCLRRAHLPAEHRLHRYGVAVTSVARTLLDLACALDHRSAVVVADSAYHQRLITRGDISAILTQAAPRPGLTGARESLLFARAGAESALESISRVSMHRAQVPTPELQVVLLHSPRIRVDFYWPELRLVGEADGMGKYLADGDIARTAESIRAQRHREQRLRDAGFEIVRWDWATAADPALLSARLRPAMARAAVLLRARAG
ncbi:MAG: type IV toxin-antitoxin system AbiEi family antitoxin domain-containing protein [Sporichthyaceae bacterium]